MPHEFQPAREVAPLRLDGRCSWRGSGIPFVYPRAQATAGRLGATIRSYCLCAWSIYKLQIGRLQGPRPIASHAAAIARFDRARRLWPWCRVTGRRHVKAVMAGARIGGDRALPKGLRHGYGRGLPSYRPAAPGPALARAFAKLRHEGWTTRMSKAAEPSDRIILVLEPLPALSSDQTMAGFTGRTRPAALASRYLASSGRSSW